MGNIIKAKCTNCNFEKDFRFGGNRMNFTTVQMVPAIDKKTREFKNVNYLTEKESDNYIFYTDSALKVATREKNTYQSFDLLLNKNYNYCTNCESFTLDFILIAFTD